MAGETPVANIPVEIRAGGAKRSVRAVYWPHGAAENLPPLCGGAETI